MKNKEGLKNNHRLTRNKQKSESAEVYTTLSTGRVSKQRLPLTPIKSSTNKRKRKAGDSDDESSSDDDNQQDEDYDDKYVNRKMKQEGGTKRQSSREEDDSNKPNYQFMPSLQIAAESTKSPDELDFLIRLNTFMIDRAYPKLIWGLRDGESQRNFLPTFTFSTKIFFSFQ